MEPIGWFLHRSFLIVVFTAECSTLPLKATTFSRAFVGLNDEDELVEYSAMLVNQKLLLVCVLVTTKRETGAQSWLSCDEMLLLLLLLLLLPLLLLLLLLLPLLLLLLLLLLPLPLPLPLLLHITTTFTPDHQFLLLEM